MGDNVNHPNHYQNIAGVEAIDILNDVVKDLPGDQGAMLWNTLKYLLRFQKKNGVEDLKKAQNYLNYLIADIEATDEAAKNMMKYGSEVLWDAWFSDEYGHTPALDEMIIVAYYSLDDAFLWKAEFKDVKDIYEFFKACKSEKDFLILLKEKAEEESFN